MDTRHHAVHPQSSVKPNPAINLKPNYIPPEAAAVPLAVKAVARVGAVLPLPFVSSLRGDAADVSDPESENYDQSDENYDPSLDDSE